MGKLNISLKSKSALDISMESTSALNMSMNNGERFGLETAYPITGVSDYNRLLNLPIINGVTLAGNMVSADLRLVSENTEAGWDENPLYTPALGEICIYTNGDTITNIKIGDGKVPIVDLPYITEFFAKEIVVMYQHMENDSIHVSEQDRARWDAKLNYDISDENLILNRN